MPKPNTSASGKTGEEMAARHLADLGYKILAKNWRGERMELDLVALDGKELVFVEVKSARSKDFGEPESWVDAQKQKHLATAAQAYLQSSQTEFESCRFDVVAVDLNDSEIRHYKSAFLLPEQA